MAAAKDSSKRIPFTVGRPIPYHKTFSLDELAKIRAGLIPEVMEDKWFIYFEEPHLYLHRSWTGQPVYRLTLIANGDGASVTEALYVPEVLEQTGPENQASLLDFLVSNLLLER
jgi:hypothetical protein